MLRKGFSLIEVNMAILIAAGGLLSLFVLFPTGLRQSEMSSEDLYQATYASSIFQMISGNVSTISNIEDWNDVDTFWKIASADTGLYTKLTEAKKAINSMDDEISDQYIDFLLDGNSGEQNNVWYVGTDFGAKGGYTGDSKPSLPEQYMLRIFRKSGTGVEDEKGEFVPAVYVMSLVSTSIKPPSIYYNNSVYSMEFSFYGRVWAKPLEVEAAK